jgi:tRNA (adenine37-N6)-methyltransferase
MKTYCFTPIGYVESPFQQKFGIPRQSGLVPSAKGRIRLVAPYDRPEALDGLETTSHLWVQWVFHRIDSRRWHTKVRPPRLGGNRRLGVFATRSGFRPNPIGLSVVRLDGICSLPGEVALLVSGIDLLDGTPVLDLKPYIPFVDALPSAVNRLAPAPPRAVLNVRLSAQAERQVAHLPGGDALCALIQETLALDPRPAYRAGEVAGDYGMQLMDYDIRWRMRGEFQAEVMALVKVRP